MDYVVDHTGLTEKIRQRYCVDNDRMVYVVDHTWAEWYDDDYVWSVTSESSNIETKLVAESGSYSSERDIA
jgi:hypothetical protein